MLARLSRITAAASGRRGWSQQGGAHGLPGWFLSVEGGDGAGKTTQIDALAAWLRKRGFDVVTTREPGATVLGAKLREILLHAKEREPIGARAEALLFAADRADHVEKVVRPALERGAVVLTDRHVDSSVAYQSGGRELAAEDVVALSAFATEGLRPDLVIVLDVDPALAWERAQTRGSGPDRLEAEPAEFHNRVRDVFRSRAAAEPDRYLVVDASEPVGVITAIIEDRLEGLLPLSPREVMAVEESERALKAAREAERREQEARLAEERAEAAREAERLKAEREETRRREAEQREEARREQARRAAEERAKYEREKAELESRAEAERHAAKLREEEQDRQTAIDAERRREVEMAARQTEARAKGLAREQAARELAGRQELTARVELLRHIEAPAPRAELAGSTEPERATDETAVLPMDLGPTQLLDKVRTGGRHHEYDDYSEYDDEDDDDAPRSRWRLGKRKP
ncbi:MAG: dTMP kinase [Actinocrinis sp.]